jgi:anaerobic selenocysteine-containing dehydrogenase
MGLLNVILSERLHDRAYVDYQFNDLQALQNLVAPFTPGTVAERTGVEESDIVSLAREFARAGRPLAVCGRGNGRTAEATAEVVAVQLLNAVVGGFARAGGVWPVPLPETATWPEPVMDGKAEEGMAKPRVDGAGTNEFPYTMSLINRLPGAILSGKTYAVEALLIAGTNPAYSQPEAQRFRQALEKIPFVVNFSSFMDETAAMSDYILPNHIYLERYDDVVSPAGFPAPYIGLVQPAVDPVANTRQLGDVILQLAESIGGSVAESFPWDDFQGCLEETLADQWDALEENGYWMEDGFSADDPGSIDVPEITIAPVAPAGDEGEYPLLLVPYDTMRLASDAIGSTPFMVKTVPETVIDRGELLVEVNPKTAGSLGLREGSSAVLKTPGGSARVKVHLFEGIQPGLVAMPRGLGHTQHDDFIGGKGVNFNELAAVVEDPVSGLDTAWGVRAKLARA